MHILKPINVGLRSKILFILGIGMFMLFVLLFFVARKSMLDGYTKLEKDNTLVYLDSANGLIEEQISQVKALTNDYARWDDTYDFMLTQDPAYIKANMSDASFANLKINGVIIVNSTGKILYKHGVNNVSGASWQLPNQLLKAAEKGGVLIDPAKNEASGLYWTPEATYIIASMDVRNSDGKGERRGSLIMLRSVNQDLLQHGSKILGVKLNLQPATY